MKIALISDIHGNAQALEAVLRDIKENKVDKIICLWDVATLWPSPKKVIDMIRDLDCPCILGNHEEALNDPKNADKYNIRWEILSKAIYWCLDNITWEDIEFLNNFKNTMSFELENGKKLFCYHWTPDSTIWEINSQMSDEEYDNIFSKYENIWVAIGGHTHIQMIRQYKDMFVVNPWSVWCAFKKEPIYPIIPSLFPFAEYAIIESDKKDIWVDLKRVDFDIHKFMDEVKSTDHPLKDWWLKEYKSIWY